MIMATLIKTDGTVSEVVPANGKSFKLNELYGLLSCELVQVVELPGRKIMICDEEGWYNNGGIVNRTACLLARGHTIVGDVLVCQSKEFK